MNKEQYEKNVEEKVKGTFTEETPGQFDSLMDCLLNYKPVSEAKSASPPETGRAALVNLDKSND
uniref:Uncharacterized protein n=1 Tax=Candidatus Kentrum sp. TC TaxID=2126339 RepID=A0A451AGT6_9GAMM|nr:MAG: hypothetical protein BECKTC1821D_GA0114238_100660 [Candidatus Kentron sp. TC]VFK41807.1 MAG: hypothetical protein BECKTC1821E_GA0114239_101445 [Candidatus Kentron sp. TC]VFK65248.1 MAG: hypothetical protein BECKTC1821F_GA0114240_11742 [Candidatus Kentron sp. TC]